MAKLRFGKIHKTAPPGIEQCKDTLYTDGAGLPGVCSYHGGLLIARKKRQETTLQETPPPAPIVQRKPEPEIIRNKRPTIPPPKYQLNQLVYNWQNPTDASPIIKIWESTEPGYEHNYMLRLKHPSGGTYNSKWTIESSISLTPQLGPTVLPDNETNVVPKQKRLLTNDILVGTFAFLKRLQMYEFTLLEIKQAWNEFSSQIPEFKAALTKLTKEKLLYLSTKIRLLNYYTLKNEKKPEIINEIISGVIQSFAVEHHFSFSIRTLEQQIDEATKHINSLTELTLNGYKDRFKKDRFRLIDDRIKSTYKQISEDVNESGLIDYYKGLCSPLSRSNPEKQVNNRHRLACVLADINEGVLRLGAMKTDEPGKTGLQEYLQKKLEQAKELKTKAEAEVEAEKPKKTFEERVADAAAILPEINKEDLHTNYYEIDSNNKAELHFDKNTYLALPTDLKNEIKRFFLFSRYRGAWVSKGTYNSYSAQGVIKKLNFPLKSIQNRGTFAEHTEQQIERAENRNERYQKYAQNAENRAQALQAEFNRLRKDWSWITQPFVNTSGGRRFQNHKNKVIARYERGFEEYNKAEYFAEKAALAEETAKMTKYNDYGFLVRKIKEEEKSISDKYKSAEFWLNVIEKINAGKTVKIGYENEPVTLDKAFLKLELTLRELNFIQTKLAFLLARKEELEETTNVFTKERLQNMQATHVYIDKTWYEIVRLNTNTVTHRWFYTGGLWKTPYSEIKDAKNANAISGGNIGYIPPYLNTKIITNTALATATSLISGLNWKRLYYAAYRHTGNHETALYTIYYIYNHRRTTNIPKELLPAIISTLNYLNI